MSKAFALTLTAIVAAAVLLAAYSPAEKIDTENLKIEHEHQEKTTLPYIFNTDCTEELVAECAIDI
jgi:hypothetical protein